MTSEPTGGSERDERLNEILAEYIQAVESGEKPDKQRFMARYPEFSDELREYFDDQSRFDQMARPFKPSDKPRPNLTVDKATLLASEAQQGSGASVGPGPGSKIHYFGDYELLEEIARGGMGVVYKARQSTLKRIVALKMILSGQLAGEDDVRRFHAEAEAAAKLAHPNIVPIFEIGQYEGQHYFSMAFVDGESLAHKIVAGPLAPSEAARIMKKVAEAVAYAHIEGVIHRDLKPANVLLDKGGEPCITDFGLAKRMSAQTFTTEVEDSAALTVTGQVLGTPSYMPPEQAAGKTDEIGLVADVYSLGAMLYCMLTGRPPFQAASPLDTLMQVLEKDPVPPRQLDPKIPRDLETICLKCLEKEPRKRYQTANELAEELRRFQDGEPIHARPISRTARAWRWCRRKPVHAALIAAAVVLLAAVGVVAWWGSLNADWQRVRHLYLAHMQLANHAWKNGDTETVERVLSQYRSDPNRHKLLAWEFHYLDALVVRDLLTIEAFKFTELEKRNDQWIPSKRTRNSATYVQHVQRTDLRALQWSPDGSQLVCGSSDGSVRVCDAMTGAIRKILWVEPTGRVFSVAWSPTEDRIAASSADRDGQKTLCLWDVGSEELTQSIPIGRGGFPHVHFSEDGKHVYESTGLTSVRGWQVATGQPLPEQRRTSSNATVATPGVLRAAGEQSPDGRWLVQPSQKGLLLHDAESGEVQHVLESGGGVVRWSPNSRWLAAGPLAGWIDGPQVIVWDAATGQQAYELLRYEVSSLGWSPDGRRLAIGGADRIVRVFDSGGQEVVTFLGHTSTIEAVCWNPDGVRLASADRSGLIKVWDTTSSQQVSRLDNRKVDPNLLPGFELPRPSTRRVRTPCVAWHPDSRLLATGGGELTIWDAVARSPTAIVARYDRVNAINWSADGRWLACGVSDNSTDFVVGIDAESHEESFHWTGGNEVGMLRISPDGQRLAALSTKHVRIGERSYRAERYLQVWNIDEQHVELEEQIKSGFPQVSWSRDGRYVVLAQAPWDPNRPSGYLSKEIVAWDVTTGNRVDPPRNYLDPFANRSPDGKRWIFAQGKRALDLWDADTREVVLRLDAPGPMARAVWSPDGHWIAVPAEDGTVAVWDGRPPSPETRQQRTAIALVHSLLTETNSREELVERIRQQKAMPGPLRQCALEIMEPLWYARAGLPALRLAESLMDEPVLKSDVLRIIQQAPDLPGSVRTEAVRMVRQWNQSAADLNRAAWPVVREAEESGQRYQEALSAAQEACAKKPGDGSLLNTLGVALYRVGEYEEALSTLRRADQLNEGIPADLAFIAMSLHQLGRHAAAQDALDQLGRKIDQVQGRQKLEAQRFLREATELMESEPIEQMKGKTKFGPDPPRAEVERPWLYRTGVVP